jgi:hypothetical protein
VEGFLTKGNRTIPKVKRTLGFEDLLGTLKVRSGIARSGYKVVPGLYGIGNPSSDSPVLVTANYKLSFDTVRSSLKDVDAWLLVVDTRGVNVWCAAGKKTFSVEEIAFQVKRANLETIVAHRELILPQFAAVGVASHELAKACGFRGRYGPIRASDIPEYLERNKEADEQMRLVTFTLGERLLLAPVEIALTWKALVVITVASFLLSGITPDIYSLEAAWERGLLATGATLTALFAGAVITPALLPWLPGRQFWIKGALVGAAMGLIYISQVMKETTAIEQLGIGLWVTVASSYLAMNFTGATPFTSLSGVEKEMRKGLPLQCLGALFCIMSWLAAPFLR